MASDSTSASAEARELSLISKVELRIALADTDAKLETLLNTYLAPLLLKLGSESLAVRNKIISVCQHINTRIQAPSIKLPVTALLKQFKEQKSQLIRHFDLVYLQQGIDRLGHEARIELLLPLLQGISEIGTSPNQAAIVFNLVLRLLPLLKLPPRDSKDDLQLKERLGLSDKDIAFLSTWFKKLLILSPADKNAATCPGLSPADYAFLNRDTPVAEAWDPSSSGGLNLTETKVTSLRFLSSAAFKDSERFLPALIASSDPNSRLSDLGDEILKRFIPNLEDANVVEELYTLYFGTGSSDGAPPARTALQIKILSVLGKSIQATREPERVLRLIEEGLLSDTARSSQGLQASKLRTQIFTFTTWVVRMGSPSVLKMMAPKVIAGLMDFIQSQGWPSPGASGQRLPSTDLSLRGLAYESIGILVPKVDFQLKGEEDAFSDFDLIRWLFTSLSCDDSSPQMFVSIEQALGSILNSSVDTLDQSLQEKLRPFLVGQMSNIPGVDDPSTGYRLVRGSHYATVRFANRFLPYNDVVARWIDLMAVSQGSDKLQEITEEGRKGLHPYWYRLLNPSAKAQSTAPENTNSGDRWSDFPKFSDATRFLLGSADSNGVPGLSAPQILSGPYSKSFTSTIEFLRNILLSESFSAANISMNIEQDWDVKLDVLLTSDEHARYAVKQYTRVSDKEAVLLFLAGALSGFAGQGRKSLRHCGDYFVSVCSLASDDIVAALVPQVLSLSKPLNGNDQAVQDTAARATGILASHPAFSEDSLNGLVTTMSGPLEPWRSAIGEEVLKVRGSVLGLSYLFSRLAFRKMAGKLPEAMLNDYLAVVFDIIETSRDSLLRRSAQVALGQISLSGILSTELLSEERWVAIKNKLVVDAKAENEAAIKTIGLLTLPFSKNGHDNTRFKDLLDALYGLHEIRSPEVHFSVGEALSNSAAGWNSKSLTTDFDVDEEVPGSSVPLSVLATICDKIIADCSAPKPSLRKASSIWLLCLVKNCGHLQEIQSRLRKCQSRFAGLLGDRDELVQETGAQGLGLVYDIGDQALKDDLVRDLVASFTATGSSLAGGKVNEDTELFEPGALPTGGGSSVNTYKDIMNLAAEAGDPTLVYRFMSLASNNALWTNRSAFSKLGISNIFSDSSVNGYLAKNPKIYPKLFRYRFDPNPNVQRSMNTIWQALVKDPTEVVDEHFDEIMEDLLKSMLSGREWRARQASCAAIADLLHGRRPERYIKYLDEIFAKAFKLLDDIKETVRNSALKLCQTITNSVIRTLETSDRDTKRANTLLGSAIPFLLSEQGIESGVQEVQSFALGALIQMIKKSPGGPLRPFIPQIMEQFLSSLSSLEPQAVNYVHLNADKYGLTSEEIDKMRLSSIRTSPMMEVIERYLVDSLDETSMKDFATRLEGVLRSAVGLPSKVGCSRVLVLLSMRTFLFRPYADRFVQLLSKYVVDRNDTVSASYCASIGYLLRLASDDLVLKTINYAKELFLTADDANQRAISAEILHSASKLSNDRFMSFAATALPFVFVAKYDRDEHVNKVFEKTWQDNVGGNRAVSLYIKEITGFVSSNLDSPSWAIKHTSALGLAHAIMALDPQIDLATSQMVWPVLVQALSGKTWEGKETVLEAFVKYSSQAKALWQADPKANEMMKTITIREAKRNNASYRPFGLAALGGVSQGRKDLDLMPDAIAIVAQVVENLEDKEDLMDVDSGNAPNSKKIVDDTLAACVKCLLQCFIPALQIPSGAMKGYLDEVTRVLSTALKQSGRHVQKTLFEELENLVKNLNTWITEQGSQKSNLDELQGPLAALVGSLLSAEIDASVEGIRRGRAQAAVAYITLCRQAGLEVDGTIARMVPSWREAERSGPVQQVLDQALSMLATQ